MHNTRVCSACGKKQSESILKKAILYVNIDSCSAFSNSPFPLSTKFHPVPSTAVVAQWVRRWTIDHRVVQLVGSNPPGDVFQIRFSNHSFILGQVNCSDITILCNRPSNCCQQNLKCFDEPLFSSGLFS